MKKSFILICSVTLFICIASSINAANITKEYTFQNPFTKVKLNSNSELHIRIGDKNVLQVSCPQKTLPLIKPFVKNNCLFIKSKDATKPAWDIIGILQEKQHIVYNLTIKTLDSITVSSISKTFIDTPLNSNSSFTIESLSSSDIETREINAESISINILGEGKTKLKSLNCKSSVIIDSSGSSHIFINNIIADSMEQNITGNGTIFIKHVKCTNLKTKIGGSGSISIQGAIDRQEITVNGNGRFNGEELFTNSTVLSTYGGTSVEVYVKNNLSVSILGKGIVNINGQPQIDKCEIYGKGQLIFQSGNTIL